MERTVPSTESEEIELYQRTYYSLLRTTDEVQIRSLVESHTRTESALHLKADRPEIDTDALISSVMQGVKSFKKLAGIEPITRLSPDPCADKTAPHAEKSGTPSVE